jgi:hypothetical protein
MKAFLLSILTLTSFATLACKPRVPKEMNISIDIKKGIQQFYTSKKLLDERPSLSLENCRPTALAKKFVMIGVGIENLVLTNNTLGFNFTPEEESLDCRIKNNPFSYQETSEDRFQKLSAKREFFNRCVVTQVTELNENVELKYPVEQPGCKITKKSKWSVDFEGAYCYFQPSETSRLSIHLDVKESCRFEKSLNETKTVLQDVNGVIQTYIAGDASGFSADLTALSTTPLRLSFNPIKELIGVSDDFGGDRPIWPTEWNAADLYLGKLRISSPDNNYDEVLLPLVANTTCKRKCKGNICTSACDYAQPVVGEFTLYEVKNGKREFLKLWHDGSVAPAQYQGVLHGMGVTIPKGVLEAGHRYEIEARFTEPDLDFAYFSGRVTRELRFERNYIGPLSRGGQVNLIPMINIIDQPGFVPEIPNIRNLSFENSELDGLSRALSTWQSRLNNNFWPPYFETMCSNEGGCQKAGTGFVTLNLEFELEEQGNGFNPVIIGGSRKSNVVTNASWGADEVPSVTCGFDDLDDEDDDFDWGDIL